MVNKIGPITDSKNTLSTKVPHCYNTDGLLHIEKTKLIAQEYCCGCYIA